MVPIGTRPARGRSPCDHHVPLLRYAIDTAYPDADTYMFIGRIDNEPWIEVAAEDEEGTN